jgi:DNA-binding transcriptional LysR family regulator
MGLCAVNERQLRYALSVWSERSFVRAAEKLQVAQSAVSAQIKSLEDQLGFKLFRRTGHGAEATEAGRTFLQQAEHAISYFMGLLEIANQLRGQNTGTLAIGIGSGIVSYIMPIVIEALKSELPKLRLEVTTIPTQRIHQLVAEERLDLGFTIRTDPRGMPSGVMRTDVSRFKMCLIARPDHPLVKRRRIIDLEDIVNEPMIMSELAAGYGELVLSMFADRGMRPKIAAIVDNVESIKVMTCAGLGVAIVPAMCTHNEVRFNQLAARSIRSAPEASISIVSRIHARSPAAERCLALILRALQSNSEVIM